MSYSTYYPISIQDMHKDEREQMKKNILIMNDQWKEHVIKYGYNEDENDETQDLETKLRRTLRNNTRKILEINIKLTKNLLEQHKKDNRFIVKEEAYGKKSKRKRKRKRKRTVRSHDVVKANEGRSGQPPLGRPVSKLRAGQFPRRKTKKSK